MYSLSEIKSVHLEITNKCQARCPMCSRRIQGGPLIPNLNLDEITLETFKKWFDVRFIQQLNKLYMCGNLGDPIIANDTLEIFEYIRSINSKIDLRMNTNGSARDTKWWTNLAKQNVTVSFGIDGLEDTHTLYRISTDWNKIIKNAKAFISAGGIANWHMLVFKHNEHQIAQCKELSQQYGFKNFEVKHTSRFRDRDLHVLNDNMEVTHILEPTIKSIEIRKQLLESTKKSNIFCKVKKYQEIYVSSTGSVSPCCWLDLEWKSNIDTNKIDYLDKIKIFPNLNTTMLKDIFDSGFFNKIEETWTNSPLKECSKQCGLVDKFNIQFDKKERL